MANQKTTSKKRASSKTSKDYKQPKWAKNVIIAILMVAIVCVTTALVTQIYDLKQRVADYEAAAEQCQNTKE